MCVQGGESFVCVQGGESFVCVFARVRNLNPKPLTLNAKPDCVWSRACVCVRVCARVCVRVKVSVCVCVRERERVGARVTSAASRCMGLGLGFRV